MGAQSLELKDIHLPEVMGWWPPAIGWWLLVVFIPLTCWFFIWLYKRMTRKTALKSAKKLLTRIKEDDLLDDGEKLKQLSEFVRRVAISLSPRADVASLTGQAWLTYLDSTVKEAPFSQGVGIVLADAHFRPTPHPDLDIPQLITLCEKWLSAQKEPKR